MTPLREKMIRDMLVRRLAPNTQKAYLYAVRSLARHYRRSPDRISQKEVEDYLLYLLHEQKRSWSTCDQQAVGLQFFFGITLGKKSHQFRLPKRRYAQRLPDLLSPEEVQHLFAATSNLKYRMMFMTAYSSGLRLNEVVHLQVNDIDSKRMVIHVRQGKGNKDRYSILSERLLQALRTYCRLCRPRPWLFPSHLSRTPLSKRSVQKHFSQAKEKAGIQKRGGMHMLRHGFCSHLLEAGVDVRRIQLLAGHKSIHTTTRYLRLSPNPLESIRSPLDLLQNIKV